jgi:ABC-type phosphate/phosphonate transport system permease subunit
MKILTAIVKTILSMALIAFCAVILAFFLTVFLPENVVRAVEIFMRWRG